MKEENINFRNLSVENTLSQVKDNKRKIVKTIRSTTKESRSIGHNNKKRTVKKKYNHYNN